MNGSMTAGLTLMITAGPPMPELSAELVTLLMAASKAAYKEKLSVLGWLMEDVALGNLDNEDLRKMVKATATKEPRQK